MVARILQRKHSLGCCRSHQQRHLIRAHTAWHTDPQCIIAARSGSYGGMAASQAALGLTWYCGNVMTAAPARKSQGTMSTTTVSCHPESYKIAHSTSEKS